MSAIKPLSPVTEAALEEFAKELFVEYGHPVESVAEFISIKFKRKVSVETVGKWLAPYQKEAEEKRKEKLDKEKDKKLLAFTKEVNEALDLKDYKRMNRWLKKAEVTFEAEQDPKMLGAMVKCIETMRKIRIKETKADAKTIGSSIAITLARIHEEKIKKEQKEAAIDVEVMI